MRISDWSSDVCSSDLDPFQPVVCGMGSRGAPSPRRIECRCQTGSRSRRKAARARTAAMTGAPDLDAMTAEEFVAYLDDLDRAEKPRTTEQIWRAAYREEQRQQRVVGYQPDRKSTRLN